MKHYLVFAGTTEGRTLIEHMITNEKIQVTACTATEYGKIMLPACDRLTVLSERLDENQMVALMEREPFTAVVDTTHPYAVIVSQNIKAATDRAGLDYFRVVRPTTETDDDENIVYVDSMVEAVDYLKGTTGNILSTTGSKDLPTLCQLPNFRERVYARILSNPEMVATTFALGFQGKHLICMQGPFSEALNTAMIEQFDISYVLTKSSGKAGGFQEKVNSAKATNSTLVVIGRPSEEVGMSLEEAIAHLC